MNKSLFFEINKENISISTSELYKRLCTGRNFDLSLLQKQIESVKNLISPKCCYNICDFVFEDGFLDFGFFKAKSKSLARLGENYKKSVFFAITLGFELEREQTRLSKFSKADAFLLDAVASAYAESVCDTAEKTIKEFLGKDYDFSRRFSPGYSDFSLAHQKDVLSFVDAKANLGITLLDSLLMIPQKSITAVMFFDKK